MAVAAEPAERQSGHLSRYRQIVEILAKYGLASLIGAIGPDRWNPIKRATRGRREEAGLTGPVRLRRAIEELGPTFIKIGQILSTRGDLLPGEYLSELEKLQDNAPPVPEAQIRETLLAELGQPIEEAFATFEMTPLASASIGQVHAATLHDGTEVVVKLQRPGVAEQVDEDLRILVDLATAAARRWPGAEYYDPVSLAQEFAQTLRRELDYIREGHNIDRFAANFGGDPDVHIPRVYWNITTARMLTMERMRGIKISDVPALKAAGLDPYDIAVRGSELLLRMILEHGFFHADPHPGNMFVEPDGSISLIDFGMVGEVTASNRAQIVHLMLSIARLDAGQLADVVLDLCVTRVHVDRNALRRDLQRLLTRYFGLPLGDLKLAVFLSELLNGIRWYHLRLPAELALLIKTLSMSEGLGVRLDPMFDFMTVYAPFAEAMVRREFSVREWVGQMALAGLDAAELTLRLPRQIKHILSDIERGGFEINVQPQSFEPYLVRLEQLVNRVILGLLASAWTIAIALLVATYHPAGLDVAAEIMLALVLALGGGFGNYVLFLMLRARRKPPIG